MSVKKKFKRIDYLGITASLACAVQCSLLPLAIACGFLGSGFLVGHGFVEILFLGLSFYFAFSSLYKSYKVIHGSIFPFLVFIGGAIAISVGFSYHGNYEIVLATFGGLMIAAAHFFNLKLSHSTSHSR